MKDQPYMHREYLPFSRAATKAEQLFYDGEYQESLEQVEKLRDMVENKIQDQR